MVRRLLIAAALAALGACYSPSVGDCQYACTAGAANACPSGLSCAGGMCRVAGATGLCGVEPSDAPPLDASPLDGTRDGAAIDASPFDEDGDGIADGVDDCPTIADTPQGNSDGDGIGNACDIDDDGANPDYIQWFAPMTSSAAPFTESGGTASYTNSTAILAYPTKLLSPGMSNARRVAVRFAFDEDTVGNYEIVIHRDDDHGMACYVETGCLGGAEIGCVTLLYNGGSATTVITDISGFMQLSMLVSEGGVIECLLEHDDGTAADLITHSGAFAPTAISIGATTPTTLDIQSVVVYTR